MHLRLPISYKWYNALLLSMQQKVVAVVFLSLSVFVVVVVVFVVVVAGLWGKRRSENSSDPNHREAVVSNMVQQKPLVIVIITRLHNALNWGRKYLHQFEPFAVRDALHFFTKPIFQNALQQMTRCVTHWNNSVKQPNMSKSTQHCVSPQNKPCKLWCVLNNVV